MFLPVQLQPEDPSVGKVAIANMLGGIGYFHEQSEIGYRKNSDHKGMQAELFTAVPSKPFFPWGVLWDEGFHQLLIWRWDIRICLDIIGHWLDLINGDGWIPPQLSMVHKDVARHLTSGNPPSLFLAIRDIHDGMKRNIFSEIERNEIMDFLEQAFVHLDAWFKWFNTTQSGKQQSSYFWHGRNSTTILQLNPKTLSSGLDDYPRASHPNQAERHLDLRCWMFLASSCMHSIAQLFDNYSVPEKEYGSTANLLSNFELLNKMHRSKYGAYFDFGKDTEKVSLVWSEDKQEVIRNVSGGLRLGLVHHIGYVSLFPFMLKILPSDSWILGKQLDFISNRSILWSDYGIRSLAETSSLYMKRNTQHDTPYWRGPIWMNMNYMILSALYHYSKVDGPYRDRARVIYDGLRDNLIRNVVHNYHKTGFLWEYYDQRNGRGKGARMFTGWTSLVLLIMAEEYT
ncbi:Zn finger-containing GTPase- Activating Protein for ARF [Turnera subulata]|uniref:Zn finger-containing GTPase- Activating Protein for ARF n=1 Tax=Turnera subulata TaxID=218843 RepID=A0A9Q0J916_9ROSI|nr:Zn finger-containing GTPase- Activating Protein for ARF [Turnera subulata]